MAVIVSSRLQCHESLSPPQDERITTRSGTSLVARQRPGKARSVPRQEVVEASLPDLCIALDKLEKEWSYSQANIGSYVSLLKLCGNTKALDQGRRLHAHIVKTGFLSNTMVANLVVRMYGKCRSVEEARAVFDRIQERDIFSWNMMIAAFAENGKLQQACDTFDRMPVKDVVARTALIAAHANFGRVEDARSVFDSMEVRDVVAWSAMITAYSQKNHCKESLEIYKLMDLEGVRPNEITFISTLDACAGLTSLAEGKIVHSNVVERGFQSWVKVATALVNMYGKCGSLEAAIEIFQAMKCRNVYSWSAIVAAHAQNGFYAESVSAFRTMELEGMKPDGVSFISLLYACSHGGFLKIGKQYIGSMRFDYGVSPSHGHYDCMLDLLGRAGMLDEAEKLIHKVIPSWGQVLAYRTLLGACKIHGDVERGERAAEKLFVLDPVNPGAYLLLMSIYSRAGLWDLVNRVSEALRDKGLKKEAGCSRIVVKNKVHQFTSGGKGYPREQEIYAEVERLNGEMRRRFGYRPDTSAVRFEVEEAEKEEIVRYHSEKLAIAFGMISTPEKQPLIIIKNLRVCSDCHTATKLISEITGRSILVRDGNRFHRVQDGVCSCGDYW